MHSTRLLFSAVFLKLIDFVGAVESIRDVPLQGEATRSSNYNDSNLAVDGISDTCTDLALGTEWQVDLKRKFEIRKVIVTAGKANGSLEGIYIDISNNGNGRFAQKCEYDDKPSMEPESRTYACPFKGRYVRIRRQDDNINTFILRCEVQVQAQEKEIGLMAGVVFSVVILISAPGTTITWVSVVVIAIPGILFIVAVLNKRYRCLLVKKNNPREERVAPSRFNTLEKRVAPSPFNTLSRTVQSDGSLTLKRNDTRPSIEKWNVPATDTVSTTLQSDGSLEVAEDDTGSFYEEWDAPPTVSATEQSDEYCATENDGSQIYENCNEPSIACRYINSGDGYVDMRSNNQYANVM